MLIARQNVVKVLKNKYAAKQKNDVSDVLEAVSSPTSIERSYFLEEIFASTNPATTSKPLTR